MGKEGKVKGGGNSGKEDEEKRRGKSEERTSVQGKFPQMSNKKERCKEADPTPQFSSSSSASFPVLMTAHPLHAPIS